MSNNRFKYKRVKKMTRPPKAPSKLLQPILNADFDTRLKPDGIIEITKTDAADSGGI